jgi:type 1 fimbriae regulatory protein FimB
MRRRDFIKVIACLAIIWPLAARAGPMTRSNVAKIIEAASDRAGLPNMHPHMLRHTCGHLLADAGHDTRGLQLWLGHADIKHTAAIRN